MSRISLVVAIAVFLQSEAVLSASPFDGEWKGTSRGKGASCTEEMTLTIADGKVTGHRVIPAQRTINLPGKITITSDGKLTGAGGRLKGKASGATAAVTFHTDSSSCGDISFVLRKVK